MCCPEGPRAVPRRGAEDTQPIQQHLKCWSERTAVVPLLGSATVFPHATHVQPEANDEMDAGLKGPAVVPRRGT